MSLLSWLPGRKKLMTNVNLVPQQYQWLITQPTTKMLKVWVSIYGTKEAPGAENNPTILQWAKDLGLASVYSHDEIPWCGLAMAWVAMQAMKQPPSKPLWALSWKRFGRAVPVAMLGDVLVYKRKRGGHVCMYVGEDSEYYHVIGANQSDMVNIVRKPKKEVVAIRRPLYNHEPDTVHRVFLSPTGVISRQEQ